MRTRSLLSVLALLLPLAALTTAFGPGGDCRDAGKDIGGQPAKICTVASFMVCPDTVPLQKAHLNAVEGNIQLTTTAPAQSVTAGAGCGHVPEPFTNDFPTDEEFVVEGSFTGNVDRVSVEIHLLGPGIGHAGEAVRIPATLKVGGKTVSETFLVTPELSDTNASAKVVLDFTGLGLVTEAGKGSTTRDVLLTVGSATVPGACDPTGTTDGCAVAGPYPYVWGTTEVPSGLTFNGSR